MYKMYKEFIFVHLFLKMILDYCGQHYTVNDLSCIVRSLLTL